MKKKKVLYIKKVFAALLLLCTGMTSVLTGYHSFISAGTNDEPEGELLGSVTITERTEMGNPGSGTGTHTGRYSYTDSNGDIQYAICVQSDEYSAEGYSGSLIRQDISRWREASHVPGYSKWQILCAASEYLNGFKNGTSDPSLFVVFHKYTSLDISGQDFVLERFLSPEAVHARYTAFDAYMADFVQNHPDLDHYEVCLWAPSVSSRQTLLVSGGMGHIPQNMKISLNINKVLKGTDQKVHGATFILERNGNGSNIADNVEGAELIHEIITRAYLYSRKGVYLNGLSGESLYAQYESLSDNDKSTINLHAMTVLAKPNLADSIRYLSDVLTSLYNDRNNTSYTGNTALSGDCITYIYYSITGGKNWNDYEGALGPSWTSTTAYQWVDLISSQNSAKGLRDKITISDSCEFLVTGIDGRLPQNITELIEYDAPGDVLEDKVYVYRELLPGAIPTYHIDATTYTVVVHFDTVAKRAHYTVYAGGGTVFEKDVDASETSEDVIYLANDSGGTLFGNTIPVIDDVTATVGIELIKKDNNGNLARGEEFTLYKDASCTSVLQKSEYDAVYDTGTGKWTIDLSEGFFGKKKENDQNEYTFDVYIMETKAPSEYSRDGGRTWKNGSFVISDTKYRARIRWVPSTGSINTEIVSYKGSDPSAGTVITDGTVRVSYDVPNRRNVSISAAITLSKKDQEGNKASGAVFTVYSGSGNVIGTMTESTGDGRGTYSFDLDSAFWGGDIDSSSSPVSRTVIIKETSEATSVKYNGSWYDADLVLSDHTYKVIMSWEPATGNISYEILEDKKGNGSFVSSKTGSLDGSSDNKVSIELPSAVNERGWSFDVIKTVPEGDTMDITGVTISLYKDSRKDGNLISQGNVGRNGKVMWSEKNGLIDPSKDHAITESGTYVIYETWPSRTIAGRLVSVINLSGWKAVLSSDGKTVGFEKGIVFDPVTTADGYYGTVGIPETVGNDELTGYLRGYKKVSVAGDKGSFTFALYGKDGKKIADGTSVSNGKVTSRFDIVWSSQYDSIFTDDSRTMLVLPEGEYEIREYVPYDNCLEDTGIRYSYSVPGGSSWKEHKTNGKTDYWYITVTVANTNGSDPATFTSFEAVNNREQGSLYVKKTKPQGDVLDLTDTVFGLYYDSDSNGKYSTGDILISEGNVSSSGNVTWNKDVSALPFGRYVLVETFDRVFVTAYDGTLMEVPVRNNSGWTKGTTTPTTSSYYIPFKIDAGHKAITYDNVENDLQEFSWELRKIISDENDISDVVFELRSSDQKIVVARGIVSTSGIAGSSSKVMWEFNGKNAEHLTLPSGSYVIREYCPATYAKDETEKDTDVRFTYCIPSGWQAHDTDESGITDYFYKVIEFGDMENADSPVCSNITNDRGEVAVSVTKVSDDNNVDVAFDLYYRGNKEEYDPNIRFRVRSVILKAPDAESVLLISGTTVDQLPYGWYEIQEDISDETDSVKWNSASAGIPFEGGRLIHLTPEDDHHSLQLNHKDPVALAAINIHEPKIILYKKDEWSDEISGRYTDFVKGTTFRIYDDLDSDGELDEGEELSFRQIKDSDMDGKIIFDGLILGNSYIIAECLPVDGYYVNVQRFSFTVRESAVTDLTVADEPYHASVIIHKTDLDDERHYLSGASFVIYDDTNGDGIHGEDEPIALTYDKETGVTKDASVYEDTDIFGNPVYISDELHFGKYVLVETEPPEGFSIIEGESGIPFEISSRDTMAGDLELTKTELYVRNRCRGDVSLTKVDKLFPDNKLSGAVFEVYRDVNGNGLIDEEDFFTGSMNEETEGEYYIRQIPYGTYLIKEVVSPSGYRSREDVFHATIDSDGMIYEIRDEGFEGVWNDAFGSITVCKTDEKTGDGLSGCEFTVYVDANGNGLYDPKSDNVYDIIGQDENGIYHLEDLPRQRYLIKETEAPEYYETDPNYYPFEITLNYPDVIVDNVTWNVIEGISGNFINVNPVIRTILTEETTGSHISPSDETSTFIDVIEYKGLHEGESYAIEGTLYDKETKEPLKDKNGDIVTSVSEIVPDSPSGRAEVRFDIDTSVLEGHTVVASEKIRRIDDDKYVGIHHDLDDVLQSVRIPDIGTALTSDDTGEHICPSSGKVTLTDKVSYSNLVPGLEYRITGILVDRSSGNSLLSDGNTITSEKVFVPEDPEGTVDITFEIDTDDISGIAIVAFETLYLDDIRLVSHEDISDSEQTVYIPELKTMLTDTRFEDIRITSPDEELVLRDYISYQELIPDLEYEIRGELIDKETGEIIMSNKITLIPEESSGVAEMDFLVDLKEMQGRSIVAFERLVHQDVLLVDHADIDDEDQTLNIVEISTEFLDDMTGEHMSRSLEDVTLTDRFEYTDLVPGCEYTIIGILIDLSTGLPVEDEEGEKIDSVLSFVPDDPEGAVELKFSVNGLLLSGKDVLAVEGLIIGDDLLTSHDDPLNEYQIVSFPHIHTVLVDSRTDDHISPEDDKVILTDKVYYGNLITGKEYELVGTLMDRDTGKPLIIDGKEVTGRTVFTPDHEDGTAEVSFEIDASELGNRNLVAFEELYMNGILIAKHNDITDTDQTVSVPDIHTSFYDSEQTDLETDGDRAGICQVKEEVTLIDRVYYSGLIKGEEYTLHGTVMVKETGEVLLDADGNTVTSSVSFTAKNEDGFIDVPFTVDTTLVKGLTLVAFETLDYKDISLVIHADIEDKEQTVHVPDMDSLATAGGLKELETDGNVIIKDSVAYDNLDTSAEYELRGVLIDKQTGETVMVNGESIGSVTAFSPEESSGTVDVNFETDIDMTDISEKDIVVYERLYLKSSEGAQDILILSHEDINDADQTVRLKKTPDIPVIPETGEDISKTSMIINIAGVFMFLSGGTLAVAARRRKKDKAR